MKLPKIKNSFETLQELIETNKSIIRFGDGEYTLIATLFGGGGGYFLSSK